MLLAVSCKRRAVCVMKKTGEIELEGKDINITGSGKINVQASGDVMLKGSNHAELNCPARSAGPILRRVEDDPRYLPLLHDLFHTFVRDDRREVLSQAEQQHAAGAVGIDDQ